MLAKIENSESGGDSCENDKPAGWSELPGRDPAVGRQADVIIDPVAMAYRDYLQRLA